MTLGVRLGEHVAAIGSSPFAYLADAAPWELTSASVELVSRVLSAIGAGYSVAEGVAIHESAIVEAGATIKRPAVIGPGCLVAAGAYVRGGCWLDRDCTLGPGAEVKSSFLFAGTRLAHFNFVGDSVLGSDVNLEAGAIVANYRNERDDPEVIVRLGDRRLETGVRKFGALIGDGTRIGANAVIAPGAILPPRTVVPRLALIDQG